MNWPKTIEDEYGVACRDCRYSRKHGAAEQAAKVAARAHSRRFHGHRVRVTKTITVAEWCAEDQPRLAELPVDIPPY